MKRHEKVIRSIAGFSLIELMVAITIGLIIMAAVSAVFVSSKRTYNAQDNMARLQENARFTMHYLLRDLRMAGYSGCLDSITQINSTLNAGSFHFRTDIAIEGLENGTGNWYPSGVTAPPTNIRAGTDAVAIRLSDSSSPISISDPMPNSSAELKVTSVSGINEGDIIMLSDCSSADVMQVTQVQSSSLKIQHNPGGSHSPGNSTQKLSKQYKPPSQVLKYFTRIFYVANDANGVPNLFMQDNGGTPQVLVGDIEDMQILYGKDTDPTPDGIPNVYLKAGEAGLQNTADWARVSSVRLAVLARTPNDKDVDLDTNTHDVNGKTVGPMNDRYQRRVFVSTVQLRNL